MTLTLFHTRFSYHQIVALNRNEGNLLWFKLVNVSYIAPLKIGENFCLKTTFPFCVHHSLKKNML